MLAVAVNGDLRVAMVIASAFQTFDVVGAMLAAPLSRRTQRVLSAHLPPHLPAPDAAGATAPKSSSWRAS